MKEKLNLESLILDLVHDPNYQPLKAKAIAKKLKLIDEEREVKRTIKRLVKQDRLAYGAKHLVQRPATDPGDKARTKQKAKSKAKTGESKSGSSNDVIGVFRRAAAGFGFVAPRQSTATDRSDDIFIPKHKTLDAAELDVVRVRLSRSEKDKQRKSKFDRAKRNGASGRIVEVIERHTHRFVGTYRERLGFGFVVVDGAVFESGILVGDAGAKDVRVGDKVVIEMVRFPSSRNDGEGVIVEVLGDRGTPGVDTLSVIRQYDLPDEFPESVLENARQQAERFEDGKIPENRTDFTDTTVITIDPKTARDFDDAISLTRIENGHWQLGVHIADVSHFVPYQSDLDNEAYQRGTSVYLPDRVIPMLPEIISNNLASLQPKRVRYCMTAIIEFTAEGVPVATDLCRGVIKSAHRFTYEEIDEYLENDRPWKDKLQPDVFRLVRDMHSLAMILRKRRMDGGAINLVLPEVKIDLDEDGKVAGAHTVENTESHQVIEEFMLAANEAVARRLADEKLFFMRRIHPPPTEAKLLDLTNFVRGLGIDCDSLQDRFELKRVVEASEDRPEQHAIHYAVLRSMQKAIYGPEEIGHYALNSKFYCHFTSPIRRYPDLIIHRAVGDLIDGKRPNSDFDRLSMLGKHCSELEKRAADAERELIKLKLLNFMFDKVGEHLHAVVTGVEAFGVFAQGIEIPAEGMIPLANLPKDKYQFDRASRTLAGFKKDNQFRLGDEVEVKVALVDPDQRVLEFELVGVTPSQENVTRRGGGTAKSRQQDSGRRGSERGSERNRAARHGRSSRKSTGSDQAADAPSTPPDQLDWESVRAVGPQPGQNRKRRRSNRKSDSRSDGNSGTSSRQTSKSKSSSKKKSKSKGRSSGQSGSPSATNASKSGKRKPKKSKSGKRSGSSGNSKQQSGSRSKSGKSKPKSSKSNSSKSKSSSRGGKKNKKSSGSRNQRSGRKTKKR